jgi:antitoxin MazE
LHKPRFLRLKNIFALLDIEYNRSVFKPLCKRLMQAWMLALQSVDTKFCRNYNVTMKTNIVNIGNSQGVRIPKILLEQSKLSGEVELEVKGDSIIISPARKPRQGWAEQIKKALAENPEKEELFGENIQNRFDEEEWEW